mgnify:CR=1 FL=1
MFIYDIDSFWNKKKYIISSKKQFDNLKQIKNIKDKIGEIYIEKDPRIYKNKTLTRLEHTIFVRIFLSAIKKACLGPYMEAIGHIFKRIQVINSQSEPPKRIFDVYVD